MAQDNLENIEAPAKLKLSVTARRRKNRDVAIRNATAGLYVLPASSADKRPLIPAFNRPEESISADERTLIADDYNAKYGRKPLQIGATKNVERVKAMWRRWPDAIPGIAVGASGLVALDADSKRGGHIKLPALLKSLDAISPANPSTWTQSGGLHTYYRDPQGVCDNTAGALAEYGCDVRGGARGGGGFVVAAGAVREDGSNYVSVIDLPTAYEAGTIPDLPDSIKKMIGRARRNDEQSLQSAEKERANMAGTEGVIRAAIIAGALPNVSGLLDPAIGFDLESLARKYPKVAEIISGQGQTHSDDRFNIIAALKSEGARNVEVAAILMSGEFDDYVGSYVGNEIHKGRDAKVLIEGKLSDEGGTFNLRNVAREYERAPTYADASKHFGVADDEAETGSGGAIKAASLIVGATWGFDRHKQYTPMEWAVEGLIPAQGVGIWYGDGNVGKSFLGLDVLDHVKRGSEWFGRNVVKGGAMYICAEGHAGLDSRLKALYDARPVNSRYESIAVRGDLPVFGKQPQLAERKLEKMIRAVSEESGEPVRVVVLDNLSRMEGSIEENGQGDLTQIFTVLGNIARKLNLVFVVIHHSTKDKSNYRGSTAIRNSADFMLAIAEAANGIRTVSVDKMRDAPKGNAIKFKLRACKVGVDQFGKDVTSCIVVPAVRDRTALMGAVDVTDEAPELPLADGPNDRVRALVAAVEQIANRHKADGEKVSDVPVTRGEVLKFLNAERAERFNTKGEAIVQFSRVHMTRLVGKAVEAGTIRVDDGGDLYRANLKTDTTRTGAT